MRAASSGTATSCPGAASRQASISCWPLSRSCAGRARRKWSSSAWNMLLNRPSTPAPQIRRRQKYWRRLTRARQRAALNVVCVSTPGLPLIALVTMPEVPGIPDRRSGFGGALAVGRKLDLPLPDTPAVRDAYAHAEAGSQPWLFNHVMRSWLYGAKLAQRRGLAPDAELVAVAVLLHDLGLARGGAPDRRFEVVGADIGRAFALSHDMGERRAEVVWDSIAL